MSAWEPEETTASGLEPIGAASVGSESVEDGPADRPGEVTVSDRAGRLRATVWALRVSDVRVEESLLHEPDQLRRSLTEVLEQVAAASAQVGLREYLGRQVVESDATAQIERVDQLMAETGELGLRTNHFLAEALPALREMVRRDRGRRGPI